MYKQRSCFVKPDNASQNIWRYMSFVKFVSLLDSSALFFSRADKIGDPFEGSYPPLHLNNRNTLMREAIEKDNLADSRHKGLAKRNAANEDFFNRWLLQISERAETQPIYTLMNCWHMNDCESAAMWTLYAKNEEGIAIKSTYKGLETCFAKSTSNIYIGKVHYVDYENATFESIDHLAPFIYKRKSFEHEKELRAIIELPRSETLMENNKKYVKPIQPPDDGLYVKVDLDILIDQIYLAPTSSDWRYGLVTRLVRKYRLEKQVIQSRMDNPPLY